MNLEPFRRAAEALPLPYKVAAAAVLVVVIAAIGTAVGGAVAHYRDARFDRAEAARAAERDRLASERDAAIKKAEAAEARAVVLEEQAAALRAVAVTAGQTAREKAAEAERIQAATDAAVAAVADLPPDAAREDIRARLRRLGY